MKRTILAIGTAMCLSVTAFADPVTITGFTKDEIRAKTEDGGRANLMSANFDFSSFQGTKISSTLVEIEHEGSTYIVRLKDLKTGEVLQISCLPGERKVASADRSMGATQMGSGAGQCKPAS